LSSEIFLYYIFGLLCFCFVKIPNWFGTLKINYAKINFDIVIKYFCVNMDDYEKKAIARCQKGDGEAFGEIYDSYIKKIYDFVYYKTMHKQTAEDLTSDIFMKAFEKIKSFNPQKGTFSSWIYKISRNTVIDHYRTFKKEDSIHDIWDLSSKEDLLCDVDDKISVEKISKYLSGLDADLRDMAVMRLWQGLSHAEIAQILGKTESAVKMSYSRILSKMKKEILLVLLLIFGKSPDILF